MFLCSQISPKFFYAIWLSTSFANKMIMPSSRRRTARALPILGLLLSMKHIRGGGPCIAPSSCKGSWDMAAQMLLQGIMGWGPLCTDGQTLLKTNSDFAYPYDASGNEYYLFCVFRVDTPQSDWDRICSETPPKIASLLRYEFDFYSKAK